MTLALDDIHRIADLAHIEISPEQAQRMQGELNNIFQMIERIQAVDDLTRLLTTEIPFDCNVKLTNISAEPGWTTPTLSTRVHESLSKASEHYFGNPLAITGQGGSIPIVNEFEKYLPHTTLVVTGALGVDSNAHAPNEFLNMDYTKKLTAAIAQVIQECTNQ